MSLANLGMWLALGLLCILVVRLPRRVVPSAGLALLRSFFPAWRFFEEISPAPRLSFRLAERDAPFGAWALVLPPLEAGMRLWLNAPGNLRLACQSLLEQLHSDLEDSSPPWSELISYQLVQALVLWRMRELLPIEAGLRYEFRLTRAEDDTELFRSELHCV